MPRTRILTNHSLIRNWVKYRDGRPALAIERDAFGHLHQRLRLAFGKGVHSIGQSDMDAMSPCSWDAWLAEFERQHLALSVVDSDDDNIHPADVNFIDRDRAV